LTRQPAVIRKGTGGLFCLYELASGCNQSYDDKARSRGWPDAARRRIGSV